MSLYVREEAAYLFSHDLFLEKRMVQVYNFTHMLGKSSPRQKSLAGNDVFIFSALLEIIGDLLGRTDDVFDGLIQVQPDSPYSNRRETSHQRLCRVC
jgi:hypothetical protein